MGSPASTDPFPSLAEMPSCSCSQQMLLQRAMAQAAVRAHEAIGKEADHDSVRAKAGRGLLCIFAAFYLINMLVKTLPKQPELVACRIIAHIASL